MADPGLERGAVTIVNETDLADPAVQGAVETYFTESASLSGIATSFGTYANEGGSLLTRGKFQPPTNIIGEIKLARDLADRDDTCAAALGMMIANAFGEGMANFHRDEQTAGFFNEVAKTANLDGVFKEMYREYLIAGQVTTIALYSRKLLSYRPTGTKSKRVEKQISTPKVGILHAEQVRLLEDDTFGDAPLLYKPATDKQRKWLEEWFAPRTTVARKAEMGREQRVWASIFLEQVKVPNDEEEGFLADETYLYLLNPKMVYRTTMPKGSWAYPRPPLAGNFALLEAKRLLNIMDYALLQGGTNYIVIAKKGSEKQPAKPAEVANLYNVIRSASRTGVLVGDHRLSLEIVTPNLEELLNPGKRSLLDRKIAMRLFRITDRATLDPGVEGARGDLELLSRVITGDRRDLKRHVEHIYDDVVKRNLTSFDQGAPNIWHPKIVLSGIDAFNQQVLKLRDRGDIPRKWAVEAAGFDYEASVEQRRREIAAGDDEVLTPGEVPFAGGGEGRPPGASSANGAPNSKPGQKATKPATPQTQLQRSKGETVKAWFDPDENVVHRVGEITYNIMEEFAATRTLGRVTEFERRALEAEETTQEGPLIVIPVNPAYPCEDFRAVRLGEGASLLIGSRKTDGAVVAKALCFRDTQHTLAEAEERAMRWGFAVETSQPEEVAIVPAADTPQAAHLAASEGLTLVVNAPDGKLLRKRIVRDENGAIIETIEEPVEDDP